MEQFFSSLGMAVLVEIVLGIIVKIVKEIANKLALSNAEFNLNGRWVNYHTNPQGTEIIEIVKIKQIKKEIKVRITQYKKGIVKKYRGNGIISGNSVMMYYVGKEQAGTISLVIKNTYGGNILEGEYLEGVDVAPGNEGHAQNKYILKKLQLGRMGYAWTRIVLFFTKKEDKFTEASKQYNIKQADYIVAANQHGTGQTDYAEVSKQYHK